MPNVISYFENQIQSSEANNYEKKFLTLITEYLVCSKKVIDNEAKFEINTSEESSIHENYVKSKGLNQINRLFSDKKFQSSNLNKKLVEFLSNELKNLEFPLKKRQILLETLLTSPFLFQTKELFDQIFNLSNLLVQNLEKSLEILSENFDSNISIQSSTLEENSFLLSLNVWCLTLFSENNDYFDTNKKRVDLFKNLLIRTEKIKVIYREKNFDRSSFEKYSNHLLRSFKYYLTASSILNKNFLDEIKEIESILEYLKFELSSPYHENRLNALVILNFYNKSFAENQTVQNEEENLFELCLKAEQTPASLDEYRQKIYYLQRLDPVICGKFFNETSNQTQDVRIFQNKFFC